MTQEQYDNLKPGDVCILRSNRWAGVVENGQAVIYKRKYFDLGIFCDRKEYSDIMPRPEELELEENKLK